MPIYEYKCRKCEHDFEILQSLNFDTTKLKCPECGASDPVKQFSSFSFKSKAGSCSSSGSA